MYRAELFCFLFCFVFSIQIEQNNLTQPIRPALRFTTNVYLEFSKHLGKFVRAWKRDTVSAKPQYWPIDRNSGVNQFSIFI